MLPPPAHWLGPWQKPDGQGTGGEAGPSAALRGPVPGWGSAGSSHRLYTASTGNSACCCACPPGTRSLPHPPAQTQALSAVRVPPRHPEPPTQSTCVPHQDPEARPSPLQTQPVQLAPRSLCPAAWDVSSSEGQAVGLLPLFSLSNVYSAQPHGRLPAAPGQAGDRNSRLRDTVGRVALLGLDSRGGRALPEQRKSDSDAGKFSQPSSRSLRGEHGIVSACLWITPLPLLTTSSSVGGRHPPWTLRPQVRKASPLRASEPHASERHILPPAGYL